MQKCLLKTMFATIFGAIILSSCGPVVQLFEVDVKVPASQPLDLTNKSIAVFSNINKINDSLLMVNLATGLAASLEKGLSLGEGAVPVFNLLSDSSTAWDIEYIRSLCQKSNSDILMVIDRLDVGKPEKINVSQPSEEGSYNALYVFVPYTSYLNVYDGFSAEKISYISQTDTVYWEIVTRNELRGLNFTPKLYESLVKVSRTIGGNLSENFFGSWASVQRYLYCYQDSDWIQAYEDSRNFKWSKAINLWMDELDSSDKMRCASAAFNLAVACEMTSRFDLALEWIEYSERCYPLKGIDNYKSILKKQFETERDSQAKP